MEDEAIYANLFLTSDTDFVDQVLLTTQGTER